MVPDLDFNNLLTLLKRDRSVRRFDESRRIDEGTLKHLVELARYCASGRNLQPLRYRIVTNENECSDVFDTLAWAGYYKDWPGPEPGQRPTAYLVQCLDTELCQDCLCDDGLQLQAITLGATALGISGCIIKAFNAPRMSEILKLEKRYRPRYVLALGYQAEEVCIVPMGPDGNIKYYRNDSDRQCVPKRSIDDLIIF